VRPSSNSTSPCKRTHIPRNFKGSGPETPRTLTDGPVADSTDASILSALTRAAAAPAGLPLFASKTAAGLFPPTAPGRTAARRAVDAGYLTTTVENKTELGTVTVKGLDRLLAEANPKPVLDDFVRVLERRESQVAALAAAAKDMTEELAAMKRVVAAVMPRVVGGKLNSANPLTPFPEGKGEPEPDFSPFPSGKGARGVGAISSAILTRLADWADTAGEDCPLPVLYRDLPGRTSVGTFHDAIRELHAAGSIYLHPWTGPLYALPEPTLALLVGHEVAYYASDRNEKGDMKKEKWETDRRTRPFVGVT
jgi:hypothetical protein